jgi:hypothetical protein
MGTKVMQMALDQQQPWPILAQIEPPQYLKHRLLLTALRADVERLSPWEM